MAITKKFIGLNAVDGERLRLDNAEALRARNFSDSADLDVLKVDASNLLQLLMVPYLPADASANGQAVRKSQMDSAISTAVSASIPASEKGAINGVATLDGSGKIPVAQLPNSVMEYKGAWDPSTNTPTLADGTGNAGDVYRCSADGSVNLGSGSILFYPGDFVIYSGSVWQRSPLADGVISVNGKTGAVTLSTSDIGEGSNQYFTDARAKAAAVANSITNGVTDVAPSQDAVFDALALKQDALGFTPESVSNKSTDGTLAANSSSLYPSQSAVKTYVDNAVAGIVGLIGVKGSKTLSGTDISNQYFDLPSVVYSGTLQLSSSRVLFYEDSDYTLSSVGSPAVTRVTLTGPLASSGAEALVSGDVIVYKYLRQ